MFDAQVFKALPVVGILRGFGREETEKLVHASVEGGLRNIEITMNTEGAVDLIRLVRDAAGPGVNVGAGTVLSADGLEAALGAGASFIVTPGIVPEVVRACVARRIPVFPGALTPSEVMQAWSLGATMVKVFPADQLGPAYIRALKAPLAHVPLMPTGGVTVDTLGDFKRAGADAFGVGGPLFDRARAAAGDWGWFRDQAARFVAAYEGA
jgi:2-dehydro-3-deoxyphosphogluconate aldolase/(4S)-4-hydroxy-2-oxoglutarate aldolase